MIQKVIKSQEEAQRIHDRARDLVDALYDAAMLQAVVADLRAPELARDVGVDEHGAPHLILQRVMDAMSEFLPRSEDQEVF
jgi:hypothetical protein